jgi:hypothetical protein
VSVAKKPRMGRPPLAKKERKAAHLSVRFSEGEHHALERAAKAAGIALSEWARRELLRSAEKGSG